MEGVVDGFRLPPFSLKPYLAGCSPLSPSGSSHYSPYKAMIEVCQMLLPRCAYPHLKTDQYKQVAMLPPLWCDRGSGRLSDTRTPKIRAILNRLIEWA